MRACGAERVRSILCPYTRGSEEKESLKNKKRRGRLFVQEFPSEVKVVTE